MADYDLSKEIGDLLRLEREKRGLTQQKFAAETTTTQQRLSRIERGTTPATTVAIQRLFEALGLRVRVTVVPLEADLDDQIDRLAATSDAERLELLELHEFVLNTLSAAPFVYSGRIGAYLQGAPVPVSVFELAIADADLDSFGEALEKLCSVRWDERWGVYCDPVVDPRRRGPLRWICGATEFAVEVEPVRPAAVTIQLAGRAVRVRPLAEIEARDADVAAVMNRVRDRYRATAAPGQE